MLGMIELGINSRGYTTRVFSVIPPLSKSATLVF